ncbi:MAG: acetate uptake transporter [Deltaproteobacteria bacterium]|nr:acetate uptake transporter [Deltaproteobacteria bacterium]MBW2123012.1 acetate uptake transporter [Deltaproteobacteria bacterium]
MQDNLSNPAPLGLTAFGMTTVLLNLHNVGLYGLDSVILAMGLFYGGIAQVIAGILEFRRGNTFGTTAFCSFGLFWLTFVFLLVFPEMKWWRLGPSGGSMAAYLFMWGLFTAIMFVATLRLNRGLQVVFLTLVVLFWLLAVANLTGSSAITRIAGVDGIICGLTAVYVGVAEVLKDVYGRVVFPIGPMDSRPRA